MTPTLSVAVKEVMGTVRESEVEGRVNEVTVGAEASALLIVTALVVVAALPEESVATAVRVYEPFAYDVVSSVVS